jgi:very-short-patch-repair endonuclease
MIPEPMPDASDYYQLMAVLRNLDPRVESLATMLLFNPAADLIQTLLECESPIEQLMYCGLLSRQKDLRSRLPFTVAPQQWLRDKDGQNRYRVDFMVEHATMGVKIAVECDGFEYHETPEAATRDKARDRFIQAAGIPVLRFTGSEIWAQPYTCAREVANALAELAAKQSSEKGAAS